MFDQNNRVKLTLGLLLAVYSLGASQGAIKSKITEHLDKENAVAKEVEALRVEVGVLQSSNRSIKKQINYFHKDEIGF
jgi:hypothetical protein